MSSSSSAPSSSPFSAAWFGAGVPTGMDTIPKPTPPKTNNKLIVNSGSQYLRFKRRNQTIFLHCEPNETLGAVKLRLAAILKMDELDIRCYELLTNERRKQITEMLEEKLKEAQKLLKKKPGNLKMSAEDEAKAMEIPPLNEDKKLWELNLENDSIVFFVYRTQPETDWDEWEEVDVPGLQVPAPKPVTAAKAAPLSTSHSSSANNLLSPTAPGSSSTLTSPSNATNTPQAANQQTIPTLNTQQTAL